MGAKKKEELRKSLCDLRLTEKESQQCMPCLKSWNGNTPRGHYKRNNT